MSDLKKLKIFFVEDEIEICKNIKEAIGDEFASFMIANNGKDGLNKYKTNKPDIVITDISMPELNGLEMISEIRKLSSTVPIIILSAFSEKDKLFKAIDMSVCKYLVKPIDVDELLDVIEQIAIKLNKQNMVILPMGYSYNLESKELFLDNKFVKLTKKEVLFMDILVKHIDSYVKNENLYKYVWNNKTTDTAVRTFVQRLRAKTNKELIVNVSGLGYQISSRA